MYQFKNGVLLKQSLTECRFQRYAPLASVWCFFYEDVRATPLARLGWVGELAKGLYAAFSIPFWNTGSRP
jgi:hypothetical protein